MGVGICSFIKRNNPLLFRPQNNALHWPGYTVWTVRLASSAQELKEIGYLPPTSWPECLVECARH